jgi:flavin-dependent thymidylate synthase
MSNGDLTRKGDAQQYDAEPHVGDPDEGVKPRVTLLWMTPDPLGAIAALSAIYSGRVVRDLGEITDEDRYQALADVQKTHLKAPLEAVKLHFLIEGVDRAFTHQHVRQRTAVYAQESMRFAVLGDLLDATTLPPSLAGTQRSLDDETVPLPPNSKEQRWREIWDDTLRHIDKAYHTLVEDGMPSEEARGLLPHCTATRLHYVTDLRNLSDHAGNRLCTQAQFHWRLVFAGIVKSIAEYNPPAYDYVLGESDWQFETLASSGLFRPVCYQLGHCPFEASFDRACTIRERVQLGKWDQINVAEWLADPSAARI